MSLTENILEGLYVLTNLSAGKTEITRKQLNNKGKKRIDDEILMPCFRRNARRNSFEKKAGKTSTSDNAKFQKNCVVDDSHTRLRRKAISFIVYATNLFFWSTTVKCL